MLEGIDEKEDDTGIKVEIEIAEIDGLIQFGPNGEPPQCFLCPDEYNLDEMKRLHVISSENVPETVVEKWGVQYVCNMCCMKVGGEEKILELVETKIFEQTLREAMGDYDF